MKEIIAAIILFLISAIAFLMSIRSFLEKGFLFHNAYLYASKQERERMDKKPYYRQSAVIFFLIGVAFLLNGLSALLKADWIFSVVAVVLVLAAIYAIVSSIAIAKRKKQK